MHKQCFKRYKKSKISPVLVHGMAEVLPFKDETFDVVIHIGGINFFTDKSKAIQEMIRIAKRFFKDRDEVIVPPVHLLPHDIKNVNLTYRFDESLYVITFTKP